MGSPRGMIPARPDASFQYFSRWLPVARPDGVEIWFRAPAGRIPDVLEIGLRGRRRPQVEAYWDGCRFAL